MRHATRLVRSPHIPQDLARSLCVGPHNGRTPEKYLFSLSFNLSLDEVATYALLFRMFLYFKAFGSWVQVVIFQFSIGCRWEWQATGHCSLFVASHYVCTFNTMYRRYRKCKCTVICRERSRDPSRRGSGVVNFYKWRDNGPLADVRGVFLEYEPWIECTGYHTYQCLFSLIINTSRAQTVK